MKNWKWCWFIGAVLLLCNLTSAQTTVLLSTVTTERDTVGAVSSYEFLWKVDTLGGFILNITLEREDSVLTFKQRIIKAFVALKQQFRAWRQEQRRRELQLWRALQRRTVTKLDTIIVID